MTLLKKPCEYCGLDLPLGVNKETRRTRSYHFERCEHRPVATASAQPQVVMQAELDELRAKLFKVKQSRNNWENSARQAISCIKSTNNENTRLRGELKALAAENRANMATCRGGY